MLSKHALYFFIRKIAERLFVEVHDGEEYIKVLDRIAYTVTDKMDLLDRLEKENTELKDKLTKAIDALEFYSKIACPMPKQLNDNEEIASMKEMDKAPYLMGGKTARQALKELVG